MITYEKPQFIIEIIFQDNFTKFYWNQFLVTDHNLTLQPEVKLIYNVTKTDVIVDLLIGGRQTATIK